ncbi:MAG: Uncharacterised protein [Halieaceae bacterium]|nr:MAG: Uncharacterised protein [Halieaceae bacterium]
MRITGWRRSDASSDCHGRIRAVTAKYCESAGCDFPAESLPKACPLIGMDGAQYSHSHPPPNSGSIGPFCGQEVSFETPPLRRGQDATPRVGVAATQHLSFIPLWLLSFMLRTVATHCLRRRREQCGDRQPRRCAALRQRHRAPGPRPPRGHRRSREPHHPRAV